MDNQRAEDMLPRFHDRSPWGWKENWLLLLSAGGRDNCNVAKNISADPTIRNVPVRVGALSSSDNDADKYEGKIKWREDNGARDDELRRSKNISFQDIAPISLKAKVYKVPSWPKQATS